jgi:DNA helicase-2/ATP-dependent DNA helicase PcrA
MANDEIFEGLNPQQRAAVETVTGPVCILAGAGSGKTTTITRRLAHQVRSGAFDPRSLLAVTFTDKAAGEMQRRLYGLQVTGVQARTFHAAALRQLRFFRPGIADNILASKAQIVGPLVRGLGAPYKFTPVADFASEIEWAKNQRITPDDYLHRLGDRVPPVAPEVMQRIFAQYESRKQRRRSIDFEDMLELAVLLFEEDWEVAERFRDKYRAFTVDEYQDVNQLQQALLNAWLGDRDNLCVVGDDYQAIYSFTGASADYLLEMPGRFPNTKVVRLEENYRSTPEVLELANKLVPKLKGSQKVLRPVLGPGPKPTLRAFMDPGSEIPFIVSEIKRLNEEEKVPLEQMAVLYRINARSELFEEAFSEAGIDYQVREDAFLARPAARQLLPRLARQAGNDLSALTEGIARTVGYNPDFDEDAGRSEVTRQKDLARMVQLADEFEDGTRTAADFVKELQYRFAGEGGRGVNLLTYHRAKGLEFDAVFLANLVAGELPFRRSDEDEERRLFYVGLTRAKKHLYVSWSMKGKNSASPFVVDLGAGVPKKAAKKAGAPDTPLVAALKEWRSKEARSAGKPAYVILHDSTIEEIAAREPETIDELMLVPGIGPSKGDRYGDEILAVVAGAT